jgi:phospholipase C
MRARCAFWTALAAIALPYACAPHAGGGSTALLPQSGRQASRAPRPAGLRNIEHVVIVVQENRSFDDLFQGYPGANTASSGQNSGGQTVPLQPIPLEAPYDVHHQLADYLAAYDGGKNDGFDKESIEFLQSPPPNYTPPPNPQYGYVPSAESQPYFTIAQQYALADNAFTSQLDGSFAGHQYLIAGWAGGAVDTPTTGAGHGLGVWGCDSPPGTIVPTLTQNRTLGASVAPCFTYPTIAGQLDAAHVTWRYYAPGESNPANGYIWAAFDADRHVRRGPDWKARVVSPETQVLTDVAAGKLANVTWIVPDQANSDHAGWQDSGGPQWVTAIVDAIGQSSFWSSTVIFVLWDDWGGWYDHVPPPQLDYDGLGFRVPLLAVSPYAKPGYVSHVQYESASVLRFVEDRWNLKPMEAADARAADPASDMLNFSKAPRTFVPLELRKPARAFIEGRHSAHAPDDD